MLGRGAAMSYDAFVSYSHVDGRLAKALQHGLEQIDRPLRRRRRLTVFRDKSDLTPGRALPAGLQRALDTSAHFVLVVSPRTAASDWVDVEAARFVATHPGAKPF